MGLRTCFADTLTLATEPRLFDSGVEQPIKGTCSLTNDRLHTGAHALPLLLLQQSAEFLDLNVLLPNSSFKRCPKIHTRQCVADLAIDSSSRGFPSHDRGIQTATIHASRTEGGTNIRKHTPTTTGVKVAEADGVGTRVR